MPKTPASLLRYALRANAAFSTVCGVIMIARSESLSASLGIAPPLILSITGGMLILFAIDLTLNSLRQEINRRSATTAVIMDAAWVAGSAILLLIPLAGLTTAGWWAIAIVADIVAVFAVLQFVGLRRTQRSMG